LCVSATSVSSPIAVALHFYPSVSTSCNPPPSSPQAQSPTPEDGEVLSTSSPTSPMDLSSMRRSPDHLAATDRHPDRSAFSTSSPREGLMKHSSSLRQCFGLSAVSPSVCLSGPTLHIYSFCIASYPGPSTLPSLLPPRFTALTPAVPPCTSSHRQDETRFKPHSLVPRLRSNGCIESAPIGVAACSRAYSTGALPIQH